MKLLVRLQQPKLYQALCKLKEVVGKTESHSFELDCAERLATVAEAISFKNRKLSKTDVSMLEEAVSYYDLLRPLVELDQMSQVKFLQSVNVLFDSKVEQFNPTGRYSQSYVNQVRGVLDRVQDLDNNRLSTVLFLMSRFKFPDYVEYMGAIMRKVDSELPLMNLNAQKSFVYSLGKLGLTSPRVRELTRAMLGGRLSDLDEELLLNLVLYTTFTSTVDSEFFRHHKAVEARLIEMLTLHLQREKRGEKHLLFYLKRIANSFCRMLYFDSPYLSHFNQHCDFYTNALSVLTAQLFESDCLQSLKKGLTDRGVVIEQLLKNCKGQEFQMFESTWHSVRHDKVMKMLQNALPGESIVQEGEVGIMKVDLLIPRLRVAIEVDGPSHFIREEHEQGTSFLPNLNTEFKIQYIRKMGFNLVSVKNFGPACDYLRDLEQVIAASHSARPHPE